MVNKGKFLICHRGALGDFILALPSIHALRALFSDLEFFGIGRPEYMRLAIKLGVLDSYHDAESKQLIDFFSGKNIPHEIGIPKGAVLWLTHGEEIARLLKRYEYAPLQALIIPPFPDKHIHRGMYYYLTLKSFFTKDMINPFPPYFPLAVTTRDYAVLHPGSGSPSKNLSSQFYQTLIVKLQHLGCKMIRVLLGPAEDKNILPSIPGVMIERPNDVHTLAETLAGASFYIGNDSGVSHLAGILGIPTFALYKTTDPEIWGVMGKKVTHIHAQDEGFALEQLLSLIKAIV